jgi:hypothetical protein
LSLTIFELIIRTNKTTAPKPQNIMSRKDILNEEIGRFLIFIYSENQIASYVYLNEQ